MAGVRLEGVSKHYRDVIAVRGLDLDIADGEFMTVVGPSGCGKTTVLRLIAGLETPDGGTIWFDGEDMTAARPAERNIAMVFEGYALFPHMAVRDNLSFALRLRHTPPDEVDRRVTEVAEAMELEDLLKRRPPELATGQAQQVAVGRAVIRDAPDVLLLDDALSHLDAQQRLEARVEVARLHDELGSTVVSVTHDQAEALAVSTRLAVMDQGQLMQVGTPHEIYQRPANVFVADFIGDPPMNLLSSTIEIVDGRAKLRSEGWELALPASLADVRGPSITVGIRPERIALGPPTSATEAGFRGRCELVEYLGDKLLVHLRVGEDELTVIDAVTDDVAPGDLVDCCAPFDRLHLFDTDTGQALPR